MTTPFLKRKIFDHRDMTYRFEDGSAPIPHEFRIETNLMITAQEVSKENGRGGLGYGAWWLERLWALKDFLKKQNPKWDLPSNEQ
jgi:hypothetical protein